MSLPSERILPLSARPRDIFFVACFSFFAFSSFFSDAWHGSNAIDATTFWGRANLWYINAAGDEFMRADNAFSRINTAISGFVYGPFYLCLVYSFVKGKNWIRLPALLYVGAMLHGYFEFMWWEHTLGQVPSNQLVFWAFNGPYGVVPILLAMRMWKAEPFKARAGSPHERQQSDRPPPGEPALAAS
jgi:hypothetical protein